MDHDVADLMREKQGARRGVADRRAANSPALFIEQRPRPLQRRIVGRQPGEINLKLLKSGHGKRHRIKRINASRYQAIMQLARVSPDGVESFHASARQQTLLLLLAQSGRRHRLGKRLPLRRVRFSIGLEELRSACGNSAAGRKVGDNHIQRRWKFISHPLLEARR